MAKTFPAEERHASEVSEVLAGHVGLGHLRVRRRGDLLNVESGPADRVVPHTRFRRIGIQKWQIEMPLTGGGWDKTTMRGPLQEIALAVIELFPWMLEDRG